MLEGWINVDAVDRGQEITSDIRKLPFPDEYADEVMAIHVIEHFYVWEVFDVLKEWIRVLKPGGELIIECPNLMKAVEYMNNGITNPQLTWWPLYGDPAHKDPLMCHKWGYTPASLAAVMKKMGLDPERKMAQYHLKERRDMRFVGKKP